MKIKDKITAFIHLINSIKRQCQTKEIIKLDHHSEFIGKVIIIEWTICKSTQIFC
jgi:hypothetical protein